MIATHTKHHHSGRFQSRIQQLYCMYMCKTQEHWTLHRHISLPRMNLCRPAGMFTSTNVWMIINCISYNAHPLAHSKIVISQIMMIHAMAPQCHQHACQLTQYIHVVRSTWEAVYPKPDGQVVPSCSFVKQNLCGLIPNLTLGVPSLPQCVRVRIMTRWWYVFGMKLTNLP